MLVLFLLTSVSGLHRKLPKDRNCVHLVQSIPPVPKHTEWVSDRMNEKCPGLSKTPEPVNYSLRTISIQPTAYFYTATSQEMSLCFQMAEKKKKPKEQYFVTCENYMKFKFQNP